MEGVTSSWVGLVDSISCAGNNSMRKGIWKAVVLESRLSIGTPLAKGDVLERVTTTCVELAHTSDRVGRQGVVAIAIHTMGLSISAPLAKGDVLERVTTTCVKLAHTSDRVSRQGMVAIAIHTMGFSISTTLSNPWA